jgi:hypothetical protein
LPHNKQNQEYKMQVKTTLNALSEAYTILDELGLAGMITGNTVEIKPMELAAALFRAKMAQEFICAVTDLDIAAAGELSLADAIEVVTRFFGSIGNELCALPGITAKTQAAVHTV